MSKQNQRMIDASSYLWRAGELLLNNSPSTLELAERVSELSREVESLGRGRDFDVEEREGPGGPELLMTPVTLNARRFIARQSCLALRQSGLFANQADGYVRDGRALIDPSSWAVVEETLTSENLTWAEGS